MKSISKIRVYTNGITAEGIGAYAYIVLENEGEVVEIGEGSGRMFAPSILRSKFVQAGKATDEMRMKMRAVYEGVRHCPDNSEVEVYTDNFLLDTSLKHTKPDEPDGDIAVRYRQYIAEHGIEVSFVITATYNEKDFPDNDHDEWTWYAYHLCCDAIKRYYKEHNIKTKQDEDVIDTALDELFNARLG